MVSELFDEDEWMPAPGSDGFTDITSHVSKDGRIARIAFDRPEVRNAFRPHTVDELYRALDAARQDPRIGVVLLTGNGPSPKDGGWAFCSGGDQRIRGRDGYKYSETDAVTDPARAGRLHILEVQRLIRFMPKVVIAVIPGWAAGGGHSLHVVCDMSVASAEHGRFKQTDADVGSFDAGYGSAYFARQIGQKFAREVFFLAEEYSAQRAYEMGAVNRVVPHAELEREAIAMARTNDPHSASAQFFINVNDNDFLNHSSPTPQGWGYAVFGKVVEGLDVLDNIRKVKTGSKGFHQDVPVDDVIIEKAVIAD